jgi:hypothetical protein
MMLLRAAFALLLFWLHGCARERSPETGQIVEVTASSAMRRATRALRVIVRSGDAKEVPEEWPLRGDEELDVEEWPVEFGIRASDAARGWRAQVWALNEDGEAVGAVAATGTFTAGVIHRMEVELKPCEGECEADEILDGGDELDAASGREAGTTLDVRRDGGARGADMDNGKDASTDASEPISCGAYRCTEQCPASKPARCCTSKGTCGCRVSGTTCLDNPASPIAEAGADAAADVGAPRPDSSVPPSGTCPTTPSYATTDACSRCICSKCPAQTAACYASSDASKNGQCRSVQECAETNHCTGEPCYCGTSLTCLLADGPCRGVIENAAGTTDVAEVQTAFTDPENSVGRSSQIGACARTNCATECGL